MKRKLAQVLSVLFALTLACPISLPAALASENQIPSIGLMYTHTEKATLDLSIAQGTATCKCRVRPNSAEYTVDVTISLKRKSGNAWINVATWSGSGKGARGVSISKTKALSVKGDYKLVLSAKIKNSSGAVLESISKTSATRTY